MPIEYISFTVYINSMCFSSNRIVIGTSIMYKHCCLTCMANDNASPAKPAVMASPATTPRMATRKMMVVPSKSRKKPSHLKYYKFRDCTMEWP